MRRHACQAAAWTPHSIYCPPDLLRGVAPGAFTQLSNKVFPHFLGLSDIALVVAQEVEPDLVVDVVDLAQDLDTKRADERIDRVHLRDDPADVLGAKVADQLEALTGKESRTVVLGHLLRGGTPTATDRLLGLRFGAAAIRALKDVIRASRRDLQIVGAVLIVTGCYLVVAQRRR